MIRTLILAIALSGCAHAITTENGDVKEGGKAEPGAVKEEAPKEEGERKSAAPKAKKAESRPAAEAGRPELAVSPSGLMVPEGPRKIQEALVKKGYLTREQVTGKLDDPTSGAVRKFQGDEGLAKTGAPDRETIRRLGLSVGDVFKPARGGDEPVS